MLLKSSVSFCRSNIFKLSLNMENIGTSDLAGFVEWKNEKILILACQLSLLEKPFLARCWQFRRGVLLTKRCKWSFGLQNILCEYVSVWYMGCQLRIYISKSRNPFSLQSVTQSGKGVMRDDLKGKARDTWNRKQWELWERNRIEIRKSYSYSFSYSYSDLNVPSIVLLKPT